MKYPKLLGILVILVLTITACSTAVTPTHAPPSTRAPAATQPQASPSVERGKTPIAVGTEQGSPTAAVPVTGGQCGTFTVQLASKANVGAGAGTPAPTAAAGNGDYLVDCKGRTLYVYMKDAENSSKSACGTADGCSMKWPPLTIKSGMNPKAGDGVNTSLLGTIRRPEGTIQVTYNGWPLYYNTKDLAPGDINGVGMDEVWYLISAAGDPMQVSK